LKFMHLRGTKFGIRFALPRHAKRNGSSSISVIDTCIERRLFLYDKLVAPRVAS
jgi:hypothetical protein